ncbi:MAG TPA: GntR family transcriptional regulator [Gaiellaceae bacterium]|nr:GntR family transcriptional regulator [Gaiellaceae bacterium]
MAPEATVQSEQDGFRPELENLTLSQRAHAYLRDEILSNRLPPGTDLQELALSQRLGVSRGPVREALGRLAAEGLVTLRPRRGAVVHSLSSEEFLEAYQVREALEALAIRLAVPQLDGDTLDDLRTLTDTMADHAESGRVTEFFEANAEFHATFVAAAGNDKLQEIYDRLVGQMQRYWRRSLVLRGDLRRSVTEHRAILRAVRSGDADRAAALMSDHIRVPQIRLQAMSADELRDAEASFGGKVAG